MNTEQIANTLNGKRSGKGFICKCPAHSDKSPSLSISEGDDGKVLLKCFAGCSTESIVSVLGLEMKDLFPESNFTPKQRKEYKQKATKAQLWKALYHELLVLLQIVENRVTNKILDRDTKFKEARPEFEPMPDDFWDRELLAAKRVKRIIGGIYGS